MTGTGVANVTVCQPDALSFVNVADASGAPPAADQSAPVCVPVFAAAL